MRGSLPCLCQARQSWLRSRMCAASTFDVFQRNKYLSLESFRKNGQGVRTPVWFAGDPAVGTPQKLYVYSEADSGKAKRIRRNSRARIAPCHMRGNLPAIGSRHALKSSPMRKQDAACACSMGNMYPGSSYSTSSRNSSVADASSSRYVLYNKLRLERIFGSMRVV